MTTATLLRCRLCGFTGPKVSMGIWRSSKGKFHSVPRCEDRLACDSRKAAI